MQSGLLRDRWTARFVGLSIPLLMLPVLSQALPATNTALALAPSQSISAGEVVTLTASVTAQTGPVGRGLVLFCNADLPHCLDSAVLGTAQLTGSGTARVKLRFGVGPHRVKAAFRGTTSFAPSVSALVDVNATGTISTTTTLSSSTGTISKFKLTTTVAALGSSPPEGGITLSDLTTHQTLGTTAFTDGSIVHNFALQSTQPVAGSRYVAGDFNNDGFPDLMVDDDSNSKLYFYEGHPDGTLTRAAHSIPTPTQPEGFVAADFNGDGNLDVATGNFLANSVSVYLGNGDGTFTLSSPTAVDLYPYRLMTGDWNGDGIPDLINISLDGQGDEVVSLQVLIGKGDGTFAVQPAHRFTVPGRFLVLAGDFNGDGCDDLAVSDNSDLGIRLSKGDGTFAAQPTQPIQSEAIAIGDFNGDGLLDVIADDFGNSQENGRLKTYLGNGNGTLAPVGTEVSSTFEPDQILVGDFNGDGISDLMTVGSPDVVEYGAGDGTFQRKYSFQSPGGGHPYLDAIVADWNGDGSPDILFNYDYLSVLLGQTQSSRGITVTVPPGINSIDSSYAGDGVHGTSTSQAISVTASVPAPIFAPAPGTYKTTQMVRITDFAAAGSIIYYTLDGSTPTTASLRLTGNLDVGWEANIKAIAYVPNVGTSQVVAGTYSIDRQLPTPSIQPSGGTYNSPQTVTLSLPQLECGQAACDIYYTLDGSYPTISSIHYTAPFVVAKPGTTHIRAITADHHYTSSSVSSSSFVIAP